ncbi:MAG: hypothetical protein A2Z28_01230 [Chloroflexi bacterium RBG_16_51_9]|nr:MAG: hypothetical protein A2Z28_01230 [Chloroflexi bacterium RBG_16_51_9]
MVKKNKASSSEIVPATSNAQKEILIWEARIAEKEDEVSELSIQIQNIKNTLKVFLGEYNSRVSSLYVKLDEINLRIKEYQLRIDLAKGRKISQDSLKNIEKEVSETFTEERRHMGDLEDEASEFSEEYREYLEQEKEGPPLDTEAQEKLKQLYRKLARKFHPDLAKNDKQRTEFHKIMSAINEAYKNGDLETLEKYMRQAEREEKIAKETTEEKLARLKQDYEIILGIIAKLSVELAASETSETYKLREKVNQAKKEGGDSLLELATSIQKEIDENQILLDKLVSEYKKTIESIGH